MNEINLSCAPADRRQWNNWTDIDWAGCEAAVQKLQGRIVKAQKEGRPGKVKALQWTLTHSFYAKALAVKRVICYIHRNKLVSVVDSDRLTYEIRRDHTCTRPSFDDRLFVAFRLGDYFRFELGVDKRSFF